MYAIIDGGSTKADWVILNASKEEVMRFSTQGFNPNVSDVNLISQHLRNEIPPKVSDLGIFQLFYYGSGCGTEKNQKIIEGLFSSFFPMAHIHVREDTLAAAYAAYSGEPAIVCILGTGSNSCFFDGAHVRRDLPSLGFLIGDEGSGSALGKQVLRRYFMKKLPGDLEKEFQKDYPISIQEALDGMYRNPRANAFLAGFNTFIAKHKKHPYFQNMVYDEMKNFLDFHVVPYPESATAEVNFIGSVANEYSDIIRAAASELNIRVGNFIQKPIESLVKYHRNYILK